MLLGLQQTRYHGAAIRLDGDRLTLQVRAQLVLLWHGLHARQVVHVDEQFIVSLEEPVEQRRKHRLRQVLPPFDAPEARLADRRAGAAHKLLDERVHAQPTLLTSLAQLQSEQLATRIRGQLLGCLPAWHMPSTCHEPTSESAHVSVAKLSRNGPD
ncbi:hypothetical protein SFR_4450 [Streptomyces sp. FR-008]|nr:hypothetical protein SFR_4450 [Streptomyces sp. FR-008]